MEKVFLSEKQLNKHFPFFIKIGQDLIINATGSGITTVYGQIVGQFLNEHFKIFSVGCEVVPTGKTLPLDKILRLQSNTITSILVEGEVEELIDGYLFLGVLVLSKERPSVSNQDTFKKDELVHDNINSMIIPALNLGKGAIPLSLLQQTSFLEPFENKGIIVTGKDGTIEWVNRAFETLSGFSYKELIGQKSREMFYGSESVYVSEGQVENKLNERKPFTVENIAYKKDGTPVWFRTHTQPIVDTNNHVNGWISVIENINELNPNKSTLQESQQIWEFALEKTGHGIFIFDFEQLKIKISSQFKKLLGYADDEDLLTWDMEHSMHPEDRKNFAEQVLPALTKENADYAIECRIKCKNNLFRYFLSRGTVAQWSQSNKPLKIVGTISDIDKIKQRDQEIETTAARFSALIGNLNDAVLLEDENRQILLANQMFCNIFGINATPESMVGKNTVLFFNESKHLLRNFYEFEQQINSLIAEQQKTIGDLIEMADGTIFERDFIPIKFEGAVKGFLWNYKDITRQVKLENKLRHQKDYYQKILDALPVEVVIASKDHVFEFVNKSAIKDPAMREWVIGKTLLQYCEYRKIDPVIAEKRLLQARKAINERAPVKIIEEFKKSDGTPLYILRLLSPYYEEGKEIEFVVISGIDITEQIIADLKVRQQKEYYQSILNAIPADVVVFSTEHKYEFINKTAVKSNVVREWLIGKDDFDYCKLKGLDTKMAETRRALFKTVIKEQQSNSIIDSAKKQSGEEEFILRIMSPHLNENGAVEFVIGYGVDITQQVISQRLAEFQEGRIRNLLQIIKDGVFRSDEDGTVNLCNNSFYGIMEISKPERGGTTNFFSLLPAEESLRLKHQVQVLTASGEIQTGTFYLTRKSGALKYIEYTFTPAIKQEDAIFVASLTDVTDQVNKEKQLNEIIEKEKELNYSKSSFIRITSHELRTPLSIIQANAEILEIICERDSLTETTLNPRKMLGRINKEVLLMTEILNQLMMISRIEAGNVEYNFERIDISTYILALIKDFYEPYSDGRCVQLDLPPTPVYLLCDVKLMRHALVNLLTNAFKYSSGKESPLLRVVEKADSIDIQVIDHGIGIPEADQNRLFNPFFRASNVKGIQGTGLGLLVIEYAVKIHKGSVSFESIQGKGTTFSISLPKNPENEL